MTRNRLRILVLGLIFSGLVLAGLFGIRALRAYREVREHRPPPDTRLLSQPRETDAELIRDWMTIPFISRMYHVPPPVLFDALGVSPVGHKNKNLEQLGKEYFPEEPELAEAKIKAAILDYQAQHPEEDVIPPFPTVPTILTP